MPEERRGGARRGLVRFARDVATFVDSCRAGVPSAQSPEVREHVSRRPHGRVGSTVLRKRQSIEGYRRFLKADPQKAKSDADTIIKNTYRTLCREAQRALASNLVCSGNIGNKTVWYYRCESPVVLNAATSERSHCA